MVSRVEGPREAQAAVVALRSLDADARKTLNASVRTVVGPLWTGVVQTNATSVMDSRVLAVGARVQTGFKPVLVAANTSRPLRGGLVPARAFKAFEFGSYATARTTYETRSRKGKRYQATRHTQHQLPRFVKTGRVLYPSVADIAPRVFALWAQTTIRLVFEAFKKGTR